MLKIAETMKASSLEQQAVSRIQDAFAEIPFLRAPVFKSEPADTGVDFALTIQTSSASVPRVNRKILCQVKASGQPRIAREACLLLAEAVRTQRQAYPVFIAPYISPAAATVCDRYNTGYLDFAGNCRLAFDNVFIKRESFPNPAIQKRDLRSLFSPKAERVLRVLVGSGARTWRTQELADTAAVSLGQVASVKKLLADREWIEVTGTGFQLKSFDESIKPLLDEWITAMRPERVSSQGYYSLKPVPETEALLVEAAQRCDARLSFTGFSAASRFSPAVRYTRVSAYIDAELAAAVAAGAGLKPVPSGANVSLIAPYDAGVFYGNREIAQAPVVSPVQIFLDLSQIKGRGEEAAQSILEETIKPLWP